MGRLGQIAGLLLLAAGTGLAAWGAPYYMLDWGGTFVMAGIALASAGLSCFMLGTILVKLAVLRADLAALQANAAVNVHHAAPAVASPAMAPEPPPIAAPSPADAIGPGAETPTPGMPGGIAGIAVAGAAVGGLAVAAKSILTSVHAETPVTPEPSEAAAVESEPDIAAKPAELTADDRASLDELLAKLALPMSADEDGPADIGEELARELASEQPAAGPKADHLYARIDEAAKALQAEAATPAGHDPVEASDVSMEQRIDDEFADLRAQLAAALPKPLTEGHEPEAAPAVTVDGADEADAEVMAAPRQNYDDVTVAEQPEDAAAEPADESGEAAPQERHAASETEMNQETDVQPDHPAPAAAPSASDEGVVAAYNVGDTSYAMYVDGRIRVSTPEGQFILGSMEELKRLMAARRGEGG